MATEETLVGIGTWVYYRGSQEQCHGFALVIGVRTDGYVFEDGTGGTRYTLRYGPKWSQVLENVRRGSFDIVENG